MIGGSNSALAPATPAKPSPLPQYFGRLHTSAAAPLPFSRSSPRRAPRRWSALGRAGRPMQVQVQPPRRNARAKSFVNDLLAGGFAGIVSKTVFAPVDRVKLILQTQNTSTQIVPAHKYRGTVDCVLRVYRDQGLLSFWRGNSANLVRYFPQQAINFACKDQYKRVFLRGVAKDDHARFFLGNLASGGAAGATCLSMLYPLDLARTRLAADVGRVQSERQFTGLGHCLAKVYRSGGVRDLYQGFPVALTGIVIFRALYMGGYDWARQRFGGEGDGFLKRFAIAQAITTASGTAVYPFDTVRRRLMMQAGRVAGVEYAGALEAARKILRKEGPGGFYSGLTANIVRSGGGALMLVVYEDARRLLNA